jgi:hypothetical protein
MPDQFRRLEESNLNNIYMLIQGFSATDEEIQSFVCKKQNIND